MKGLFESSRLEAKVNGEWYPVTVKPRHVKALQLWAQSRNGDGVVEMDQTIYLCWIVLHDAGMFTGDLESFELALDDVAPAEEDTDPKA